MPLAPGTHLGPYEIVAPLGAGGRGEVYRARDTRLERTVAYYTLVAESMALRDHEGRQTRRGLCRGIRTHCVDTRDRPS